MKLIEYWGELSTSNKYGLSVVAAIILLGIVFFILR